MRGEHTAIKAIVFMGLIVAGFLLLTSFALRRALESNSAQRVRFHAVQSPFQAARACRDLRAIVGYGARPGGSEALGRARGYIQHELTAAGVAHRLQTFEVDTPQGRKRLTNIVGTIPGFREEMVLLCGHYDTKWFPDRMFAGANDGGSSAAWLLEMARILGPRRPGRALGLVWFDGHESYRPEEPGEALYGSHAFIRDLQERNEWKQIKAVINVGMIGDCYLSVSGDPAAPDWLWEIVWESAKTLGCGRYFSGARMDMQDDHLPFQAAGMPSITLRDGVFGGSPLQHRKLYHTAADTLETVCEQSLQVVGDVLYDALPALDGALDGFGKKSDGR